MKISTKGRYALRLMLDIANQHATPLVSLADVSVRQNLSVKYLEHICSSLCKEGLLQSVRGAKGGYALTRKPSEYKVGEILLAAEENLDPVLPADEQMPVCSLAVESASELFWEGLSKVIHNYVNSITLQDLLTEQCNGCKYISPKQ